jgi:iron complex transport system ATP-binding protein
MSWRIRDASVRYRGAKDLALRGVSCDLTPGALTAVIGPNGAGKSTLVRLLLGTIALESGQVALDDRPLAGWTRREIASRISVLPQREEETFVLTGLEVAAMGRYPHLGPWRAMRATDWDVIDAAMEMCGASEFCDRPMHELSGGERQRVRIARALAQDGQALILDEPTANLDLCFEMEIFELMRRLADSGRTVVAMTHNINLAARYADSLVILKDGQVAGHGSATSVISAALLGEVYKWPTNVYSHAGPGNDTGAPQLVPIARYAAPSPANPAIRSHNIPHQLSKVREPARGGVST